MFSISFRLSNVPSVAKAQMTKSTPHVYVRKAIFLDKGTVITAYLVTQTGKTGGLKNEHATTK